MTLQELLYSLNPDIEVGIWDIRYPLTQHPRKYQKHPTRQTYCKVKNLKYGDILDLLKLDVLCINIYKEGLMIRLNDKAATKKSLEHYDLVYKLKKVLESEVSE